MRQTSRHTNGAQNILVLLYNSEKPTRNMVPMPMARTGDARVYSFMFIYCSGAGVETLVLVNVVKPSTSLQFNVIALLLNSYNSDPYKKRQRAEKLAPLK